MNDKKTSKKKKKSSVRHTRAIQRDRSKRLMVDPSDDQVEQRFDEIIKPATLATVAHFHQQRLLERTLTLPVMVAFVVSLIWRQIGGISELARMVQTEYVLWEKPIKVSQQALSQRLNSLPARLFYEVLEKVLLECDAREQDRERPQIAELAWAREHYTRVVSVDGSTLDALVRKMGLLKDLDTHPLAGKMTALLDGVTRLPVHIWYEANPQTHDQSFLPQIQRQLEAGMLLIFDMGYTNFGLFQRLTGQGVTFITRAQKNLSYEVDHVLQRTARGHDRVVWIGQDETRQRIRLIEVLYNGTCYRYVTNECDPLMLPTPYAVALYWQRWRIEDAYNTVKRLLGLAYFWCGSQNAIELQLWSTWMLYAVLVDLTDEVAALLQRPFAAISMEMVDRNYFTQAHQRGDAHDLIAYLATNAKLLGIIKRKPPPDKLDLLLSLTCSSDS